VAAITLCNYALKSLSAELLQRNTFRAAECATIANARILAERQVIQLSAILTNFFSSLLDLGQNERYFRFTENRWRVYSRDARNFKKRSTRRKHEINEPWEQWTKAKENYIKRATALCRHMKISFAFSLSWKRKLFHQPRIAISFIK